MKKITITFVLCCLILLGCSSKTEWKGTKEIKNGIVYMKNPEKGMWKGKRKLLMEELLSIGIEEGDDDYILARPSVVLTDVNENIYISDFGDECIKVYDSTGTFLRRIGRPGQGPGELIRPGYMAITKDGLLCINGRRKVSIFTVAGEFVHNFNINEIHPLDMEVDLYGKSLFFTRLILLYMQFNIDGDELLQDMDNEVYQYDLQGNLMNRFCELETIGSTSRGQQYSTFAFISLLQSGELMIAFSYPYKILKYTTDGTHLMTITRESEALSQTELTRRSSRSLTFERIITRMSISNKPLFLPDGKFMVPVSDRGADFVARHHEKNFKTKYTFYDLYDSEGHFLQSLQWKNSTEERIAYIDSHGNAYTISSSGEIPKVRKYHLSIVDK